MCVCLCFTFKNQKSTSKDQNPGNNPLTVFPEKSDRIRG